MASTVYYRFQSQKEPSRILFDGTGISVFDLKREILLKNKLDTTADTFELRLTNPDNGDVYVNDSEVIPRSTSVLARRIPVRANARDAAVRYVSGSMVVNAKNAARREDFKAGSTAAAGPATGQAASTGMRIGGTATEEDMINAMFQAQGEQWQKTQQEMETKAPVYTPRNLAPAAGEKEPPPGYICHRCGQKGHYISHCPTLNDPTWEAKRVRRTTGIPKSMLRTVEKPADDDSGSYLMDADGQYVVAVADDRSWKDFQKRQLQQTAKARREVPDELQDPITHELIVDPVKTPCCGKTYSDQSIQDALISSEFKCPNCGQEDVYIDQLSADEEMAKKVYEFDHQEDGDGELKRERPDDDGSQEDETDRPDVKRAKSENDISEGAYESDDEKSDANKTASVAAAAPVAPVAAVPVFPFMFPPFFMPPMIPSAPVAENRTLRPYNMTTTVEEFDYSESSESDDDRRSRRGRR
ncbi:putative RING finger protein P8B7.15c [Wickerhamiella sorbophila]|uniref:Putative RING finger protein P8B7.15c n=1 Tax=Wickerhamiella sorbophila TaxID=45607 RepID=A0A2T0FNN4_9ASCO|nr:putative RING finger protein P8B7.15c [Wickerhamiella sorbophila]PRT56602.1 putative RING finger protein P8B7.15c [Wickerhamiella sorbophila]